MVGAVHVEPEQVLDPVVRVRAAARRRAHLRHPRPHGGGGRNHRDRARRDAVRLLEQLVAGQPGARFRPGASPVEDAAAKQQLVEGNTAASRARRRTNDRVGAGPSNQSPVSLLMLCAAPRRGRPASRSPAAAGGWIDSTSRPLRAISQEVSEFEFHISPGGARRGPRPASGPAAPARAGAARSRVVAQAARALDRLGEVGDDAVAPAADLVAKEPEPPGGSRPNCSSATTPRSAPSRPGRRHLDHKSSLRRATSSAEW